MKHLEERALISQEAMRQAVRSMDAQRDEIMRAAIKKHFGGDPMDHAAECTLQTWQGHLAFRGRLAAPSVYRLIRNRDEKILAEVKIHFGPECKLERRIFE